MKWLYNGEQAEIFKENEVEDALANGWSETRKKVEVMEASENKPAIIKDEKLLKQVEELTKELKTKEDQIASLQKQIEDLIEADITEVKDELDSMEVKDLRDLGKRLKIKHYHLINIDKLKEAIRKKRG